jgi:hypothetical protein
MRISWLPPEKFCALNWKSKGGNGLQLHFMFESLCSGNDDSGIYGYDHILPVREDIMRPSRERLFQLFLKVMANGRGVQAASGFGATY